MKCDELKSYKPSDLLFSGFSVCKKEDVDEAIAELRKENESLKYSVATLDTDYAMSTRWRNVSEELPEENKIVLCITPHYRNLGYHYSLNYIIDGEWSKPEIVKFWMPLPKAPRLKNAED